VVTDQELHELVFPHGCPICEVEVGPETGGIALTRYASVDDVGRCINPLIVHGQTHGAIAQGVGQALWEQCYVDRESGQPLVGSLMDYGVPRADTVPSFVTEIAEVLSPTNPLGIKAGGEGGTTAAPAVVISAILDALRDYGVRGIRMPGTPYNVWKAIQDANAEREAGEKPCRAGRRRRAETAPSARTRRGHAPTWSHRFGATRGVMRKRRVRGLVLSRSRCLCSRCRSLQRRRWHSSRKSRCRSSFRSRREHRPTVPPASSPMTSARDWGVRSSSSTGPALAARSVCRCSRSRHRTATRSASARPARSCSIPTCRAIRGPTCCASLRPWPS